MIDLLRRCRNLLSHPPLWWKDNEANRERLIADLDAALAESERDWSLLEATQESLREHMAEIHRLRAALEEPVPCNKSCAPGYCYCTSLQRKPLSGLDVERLLEQVIGSLPAAQRLIRAVERAHGIGETNGN